MLHKKLKMLWILILHFVASGMVKAVLDPIALKHRAEVEGVGYKVANLEQLRSLFENKNFDGFTILVPAFESINSDLVKEFLSQHNLKIDLAWQELIRDSEIFANQAACDQCFSTKKYPSRFFEKLAELRAKIERVFDVATTDTIQTLNYFPQMKKIKEFGKSHGTKLMVRSTGKEDTDKIANAGGNESVANVSPNEKTILAAMKIVVLSYFSEKSLIQRLGAGDQAIFKEPPFIPVLLQIMVGEKIGKSIPSCGVMFTEDPESSFSRGKQPTTGITIIQSSFGHNEGVVNSIVSVDTFYTDSNNHIVPVMRPKYFRLVPEDEGKLQTKDNPEEIIKESSLSVEAIKALKAISERLENYYQKPMDVEFVVDHETKTIFLVQARPITYAALLVQSCYLVDIDKIPDSKKITGNCIGSAGGQLRIIRSARNCIISKTLPAALEQYQSSDNAKDIECILVGAMAPATSHEATTFRGESKPVLFVKDLSILEQWIEKEKSFVVDLQQEIVIQEDGVEGLQQLIDQGKAHAGWISYPMPRLMSVGSFALQDTSSKPWDAVISIELHKKLADKKTQELVYNIKTLPRDEALNSLFELMFMIDKTVTKAGKKVILNQALDAEIEQFGAWVYTIANSIKSLIGYQPGSLGYILRLFSIRQLETLIYQQPGNDIIDGFSLVTLAKTLQQEASSQKLLLQKQKIGFPPRRPASKIIVLQAVQYIKLKEFALTNELQQEWLNFVSKLTTIKDVNLQKNFNVMFAHLGRLNILPLWQNTLFAQTYKDKSGNAEDVATTLSDQYSEVKIFIDQLNKISKKLESINLNALDNPSKFEKTWNSFINDIVKYFKSEDFLTGFNSSNQLGKMIALHTMEQLVSKFDGAIKTVEGSANYKIVTSKDSPEYEKHSDKIFTFKKMLERYRDLLILWTKSLQVSELFGENEISVQRYRLNRFDACVTIDSNNLKSSRGFDVGSVALGSGGLRGIQPTTLEDFFTLIHQSLLNIVSGWHKKIGGEKIDLPNWIQKLKDFITINKFYLGMRDALLVGVQFDPPIVSFSYNISLGNHSARIILTYNKKTNSGFLEIVMIGDQGSLLRWNVIRDFVLVMGSFLQTGTTVSLSEKNVSGKIVLGEKSNISLIMYFLDKVIDLAEISLEALPTVGSFLTSLPKDQQIAFAYKILKLSFEKPELIRVLSEMHTAAMKILIENKQDISLFVNKAVQFAKIGNPQKQAIALSLLSAIVQELPYYQQAFEALNAVLLTKNPVVQEEIVRLCAALLGKKQIYPQIITVIANNLHSVVARNFLQEIPLDVLDLSPIIPAAITLMQDNSKGEKILLMFYSLLDKGKGFPESIKVACGALKSSNDLSKSRAVELFNKLFEYGKGFDEAEKVLNETLLPSNEECGEPFNVKTKFFINLVEHEKSFSKAVEYAALEFIYKLSRGNAMKIFSKLFGKGKGFTQAANAAVEVFKLDPWNNSGQDQYDALGLFEKIFDYGYGFEQAQAVIREIQEPTPEFYRIAQELQEYLPQLQELIAKKQADLAARSVALSIASTVPE
ncbi:MAG: hypothetical protein UR14_C0007G0061 [candidate division TM6 bacterium GW2011_GWE2_31_21]|nr:MAG: hypothetical protein UR14_C0007G0061 [candidate division TM6 bacterium GW2011_GWE2_31_21]KKP53578.1 MAG: hypothetical protein UR43_C0004G0119 [candidate division TM6 bacterium GW2011_GWF2_33_332]